eukprot:gene7095-2777_t
MSANEVTSCESLSCGGRPYMEDRTMTAREGDTFFAAVFDGHGGSDAADYAKANLWKTLKAHALYNSNSPEGVKEAIREAFLTTHKGMEAALPTWPRRADGFNSTAGTTCTVCLLRGVQLWTAHVGDSHEQKTLNARGGEVVKVTARNLARVVWRRPKIVTGGKVTRNTPIQKIPFLNMTRSLGDLWSWNPGTEDYNVSPDPDISYRTLSPTNTTLVLASDGVWDVLSAEECLGTVAETMNRAVAAARRWGTLRRGRADNISAIVVFTQFATAECACAFVVPGGKNPLLTRHLTTSTDPPEYSLDEPAARMKDVDEAATAAAMLAPPAAAMATVAGTPAAAVIAAAGRNRSGGGGEGGAIACGSSATTVQKKRRPVGIRGIAEDVEMAETASAGAGAGADADGARDGPNAKRIRLIDPAAVADEVRPIVVTPTLPEPEA